MAQFPIQRILKISSKANSKLPENLKTRKTGPFVETDQAVLTFSQFPVERVPQLDFVT